MASVSILADCGATQSDRVCVCVSPSQVPTLLEDLSDEDRSSSEEGDGSDGSDAEGACQVTGQGEEAQVDKKVRGGRL